MFLPLILLAIFTFSCSSDNDKDDESQDTFETEYFSVINGEFSNADLPGSSADGLEIIGLTGNSSVIAGGSNPISVVAPEGADNIIIGVGSNRGYFTIPVGPSANSNTPMSRYVTTSAYTSTSIQLLIGQGVEEGFTISFATQNSQGVVGPYYELVVNYVEAGDGILRVNLSWDQQNDVDLHLREPNGEHIYFGNRSSSNGGYLDLDSNAGCGIDDINNENIYYEDDATIEYGEYEVLVDLWSACGITDDTNYIITAYYGGRVIATTEGNNTHSGVLVPEDDYEDLISVMKFNIQGPPSARTTSNISSGEAAPAVFKFNFKDQDKFEEVKVLSPQKL